MMRYTQIPYRQYIKLGVPVTVAATILEYWLFQRFG